MWHGSLFPSAMTSVSKGTSISCPENPAPLQDLTTEALSEFAGTPERLKIVISEEAIYISRLIKRAIRYEIDVHVQKTHFYLVSQ